MCLIQKNETDSVESNHAPLWCFRQERIQEGIQLESQLPSECEASNKLNCIVVTIFATNRTMQTGQIAGESSTISRCVIVIHSAISVEIPAIVLPQERKLPVLDQDGSRWMLNAMNPSTLNVNTKNNPKSMFENGIVFMDWLERA